MLCITLTAAALVAAGAAFAQQAESTFAAMADPFFAVVTKMHRWRYSERH
jgi:hypothetical protein